MTLEEKLRNIDTPAIASLDNVGLLPSGTADTIKIFFEKFVKPRFPETRIIKEWHNILMQYTDKENWPEFSGCVRFGNNGGKKLSKWGESDYYKLRRGWLTKNTSDNFEYFFADNAFPAFVYKLALDNFCPSNIDELRSIFHKRKFPYSFGFFIDTTKNEYKGVVVSKGKNPGFLGNYKLSHVFDAGECFDINGIKMGDARLSDDYYPIGHSDDFLNQPDHIRRMKIDDKSKEVIIAKFLRFAHPFNYFLTPTKTHHICTQKVYKKDIGEDPRMISYIKSYLKTTYPKEYNEFVERIMWYDDSKTVSSADGSELIEITYGLEVNTKKHKKIPPAPKNKIDLAKISADPTYLDSFKVGEIANQILRLIIEKGVDFGIITEDDINKFETEKGRRKSTFMISKPLLSSSRFDNKGYSRYYDKPIECYNKTLYLYKDWDNSDKELRDNMIRWVIDWTTNNSGLV